MIDRNARARLAVRLRRDSNLNHSVFRVATALLFACMNGKNGRVQAFRQFLADEAEVSLSSVDRAIVALKAGGYLDVVPTWGQRMRQLGGRWFRPRGASVFVWRTELFLVVKKREDSRQKYNNQPQPPLDPDLAAALARLGHAMADRFELSSTVLAAG